MLEAIEHLLILQDRDRKILSTREELADVEPQRRMLESKMAGSQSSLDAAKLKGKQIETERKKLELEVDAKKQQIERYSLQQFQTKKNEEFRALTHEIDQCKEVIVKLEDQQLELMEQAEVVQKEVAGISKAAAQLKKDGEEQLAQLAAREQNLRTQLAELESDRDKLASAVDGGARMRYERLFKNKGENVVVGVQHGVCGGCHMKLPIQVVVSCQAQQELIGCTHCGRILYYTRDMDLAVVE